MIWYIFFNYILFNFASKVINIEVTIFLLGQWRRASRFAIGY